MLLKVLLVHLNSIGNGNNNNSEVKDRWNIKR